ncbi:MAG: hypothetical protein U1E00_08845 [Pseudoxanthomonas sp.]|nr:hypothetical protein [Pseudoxanthomonas sp.]
MDLATLQTFLAWCAGINYALLLVWFGVFTLAHDGVYRMHARWFRLSPERFDELNYAGVAIYKIGIMLFCVVPLVAVTVMLG